MASEEAVDAVLLLAALAELRLEKWIAAGGTEDGFYLQWGENVKVGINAILDKDRPMLEE
jgi:hypothetical protein